MQGGPLFQRRGKCRSHNHILVCFPKTGPRRSVLLGVFFTLFVILLYVQEDDAHLQTALRLISIIGYSLSLSSLTAATLVMGLLRSAKCYYCLYLFTSNPDPSHGGLECREAAIWRGRTRLARPAKLQQMDAHSLQMALEEAAVPP